MKAIKGSLPKLYKMLRKYRNLQETNMHTYSSPHELLRKITKNSALEEVHYECLMEQPKWEEMF